ncbi:General transcription factor II-I repeat domain-containing protein 2 [Thelohanellus kitauei]|uniref:General transcription factor II-I repeat domain-containing protein 2 n=1 Tax=Thelohanellus kitauei TaxID=669202 RepID=A0A0C2IXH2_THEKT|nr:General transcription factor II-I repeat domain-containing protein 2 [Thelohanellus kitauei]
MLDVVEQVCPEQKNFREVSLSRRTVSRRTKEIAEDLKSRPIRLVSLFEFFSLTLDDIYDIVNTAQFLIFLRGISENFEIAEEMILMEPMNYTTTGEDIFVCDKNALEIMELTWQKMV